MDVYDVYVRHGYERWRSKVAYPRQRVPILQEVLLPVVPQHAHAGASNSVRLFLGPCATTVAGAYLDHKNGHGG
jgi:hypothetical protein